MASIKNEHIVWAFAEREDGKGHNVFIGLTEQWLKYLRDNPGNTLDCNPPGNGFINVVNVHVFHEKSKSAIKDIFRKAGVVVSEVN